MFQNKRAYAIFFIVVILALAIGITIQGAASRNRGSSFLTATDNHLDTTSCNRSLSYWAIHPELLPPYIVIGTQEYRHDQVAAILGSSDPAQALLQQVIAAFLNTSAQGRQGDIDGNLLEAYQWLVKHPAGSSLFDSDRLDSLRLIKVLGDYNDGLAGLAPCDGTRTPAPTNTSTSTLIFTGTHTPSATLSPATTRTLIPTSTLEPSVSPTNTPSLTRTSAPTSTSPAAVTAVSTGMSTPSATSTATAISTYIFPTQTPTAPRKTPTHVATTVSPSRTTVNTKTEESSRTPTRTPITPPPTPKTPRPTHPPTNTFTITPPPTKSFRALITTLTPMYTATRSPSQFTSTPAMTELPPGWILATDAVVYRPPAREAWLSTIYIVYVRLLDRSGFLPKGR